MEGGRSPWGYGDPPPNFFFLILRPRGFILGNFWPIWLCVLALLRKAFAAKKRLKYNRLLILAMEDKLVLLQLHQKKIKYTLFVVQHQLFYFQGKRHTQ